MKRHSLFLLLLVVAAEIPAQARRRNIVDTATLRRSLAYERMITEAASRYSVDARLLWTIAYLESRFRPEAVSRKGARGMMQLMPATGRRYGLLTRRHFHDPLRSIEAAARYVRYLNVLFAGRVDLILAAYNAGEGAVVKAGYLVPRFRETRSYVLRGMTLLAVVSGSRDILSMEPNNQSRLLPSLTRLRSIKIALLARNSRSTSSGVRTTRSIYFSF